MKMTKIILSAFAFMFALAGTVATNVSVAASEVMVLTKVGTFGSGCITIGQCSKGGQIECKTFNGSTAYTLSSGTCGSRVNGSFVL
ncbi:DUF6520 family protein [Fulvivirgaceae bacterium BMA12]|uniref:DUF6520 family protein n=1 Tax=Agaribacillus aureus TaxID=3051825 RepID=A0ABT8L2P0_9BACT|nr:DUF6520 family protein [Fulvivirgaceae bacterium BMA12]